MKLNLGAGACPLEGYVNLDGSNGDIITALSYKGVTEIRASHVLEHFSIDESIDVLAHWVDCLSEGGVLKIAVPDFADICRRFITGKIDFDYEMVIMGGQTDERDYHKSLWTNGKLRTIMERLGLVDIQTWQSEIKDCASYPFSLNLKGTKPHG
jgi:predicted SAM-dependent methyltransferase